MKGTIRIDRLETLLAHMHSKKSIHQAFTFAYYNEGETQDNGIPYCGTSGCMMGEMPGVDTEFGFTPVTPVLQVGHVYNKSLAILFHDARYEADRIREALLQLNWFDEELADDFMSMMHMYDLFDEETNAKLREVYIDDIFEIEVLPNLSAMFYFGLTDKEYGHIFLPWQQRSRFVLAGRPQTRLLQSSSKKEVLNNLQQFIEWAKASGRQYTGQ
jgi:hypothetical protein